MSDVMAWMRTDKRMPAILRHGGTRNNARHVHRHFIAVNVCEAARCTERPAVLEFSSCTRAVARIAPVVSCGETCIHRGPIVSQLLRRFRCQAEHRGKRCVSILCNAPLPCPIEGALRDARAHTASEL